MGGKSKDSIGKLFPYKEYEGIFCVYKIVNSINNKIYIGSTSDFSKRRVTHFRELQKNIHHNSYLQRSYNKYGKDKFIIDIIEKIVFPKEFLLWDKRKILLDREQSYINIYSSAVAKHGYNLDPIAGSRLGTKASENAKKKMSESQKKLSTPEKTQKFLESVKISREEIFKNGMPKQWRDNIGKAIKGRKLTEEWRLKMIRGLSHQIKRTDVFGNTEIYESVKKASEENNINKKVIRYRISKKKFYDNYFWEDIGKPNG